MTDDPRTVWEKRDAREKAVREMSGAELDARLGVLIGERENGAWWFGAASNREVAMQALTTFEQRFPKRVSDFSQWLVVEVDPDTGGVFYSAIECNLNGASGPELVVLILRASPAAIVRAIILAMPERET